METREIFKLKCLNFQIQGQVVSSSSNIYCHLSNRHFNSSLLEVQLDVKNTSGKAASPIQVGLEIPMLVERTFEQLDGIIVSKDRFRQLRTIDTIYPNAWHSLKYKFPIQRGRLQNGTTLEAAIHVSNADEHIKTQFQLLVSNDQVSFAKTCV